MRFNYFFWRAQANKKYLLLFFKYFSIYAAGAFMQFEYPLTSTNIIGQLGFQLLLSGPSEDLLPFKLLIVYFRWSMQLY